MRFLYFYHHKAGSVILLFRPQAQWVLLLYPTDYCKLSDMLRVTCHVSNVENVLHTFFPMVKFSANQRADTVISQPMRFSVPPVSVKILRTGSGLVVGQPRTVECEVRGARPNHRVSWWKNGARLSFSQTESSPDGGTLVSSIVIVPEMTDSEATLQCRAETPGLAEVREHKWQLPVQCKYLTGLYWPDTVLTSAQAH